jgi:hypothetical protein
MKGRSRCRLHGGANPGAPKGNRNAVTTGRYSADALAARREATAAGKLARQAVSAAVAQAEALLAAGKPPTRRRRKEPT